MCPGVCKERFQPAFTEYADGTRQQQRRQQQRRHGDRLRCYDEFSAAPGVTEEQSLVWTAEPCTPLQSRALSRNNQGSRLYLRSSSLGWAPALSRRLLAPPLPCYTRPARHYFTCPPPTPRPPLLHSMQSISQSCGLSSMNACVVAP